MDPLKKFLSTFALGPLLARALAGSAGLRILGMGFGFLVGIQLARELGAEGYGIYGLAMSVIGLLMVPTELGLPRLLTREVAARGVANDWSGIAGVLTWSTRSVLAISAVLITLLAVGTLAGSSVLGDSLAQTLLLGGLLVPLAALSSLRGAALQGLQRVVLGQLPDTLIRPASFSLLLFLLPHLGWDLEPRSAMVCGAFSAGVSFVFAHLMLRSEVPRTRPVNPMSAQTAAWWASALPMALAQGILVLRSHLAILMIGALGSVDAAGVYRVATSVVLLVSTPIALANVVAAPMLARLHAQHDRIGAQRLITVLALGMTLSTGALTLPFVFAGEHLLTTVFGADFADTNHSLLVLCVGVLITAILGPSAVILNMTGHERSVTRAALASLLLLLVITPFCVMLWDAVGAALATTIAALPWSVLMWRDARRLLSVETSILAVFPRLNPP